MSFNVSRSKIHLCQHNLCFLDKSTAKEWGFDFSTAPSPQSYFRTGHRRPVSFEKTLTILRFIFSNGILQHPRRAYPRTVRSSVVSQSKALLIVRQDSLRSSAKFTSANLAGYTSFKPAASDSRGCGLRDRRPGSSETAQKKVERGSACKCTAC